jgi:hypothetical protein
VTTATSEVMNSENRVVLTFLPNPADEQEVAA